MNTLPHELVILTVIRGGGYGYSLPHQNKRHRFLRSLPWVFELESSSYFPIIWPTLVFSIARVGMEKKDRARLEFTYPFSSLILPLRSKSKMALRSLSTHTLACLKANPTVLRDQCIGCIRTNFYPSITCSPTMHFQGESRLFSPQGVSTSCLVAFSLSHRPPRDVTG